MPYKHWFVSRQKRQLTTILPALFAYHDVCVGKEWTRDLQLDFEDVLDVRNITRHGKLRSREEDRGGGGTRTLFKQMKDLGLVFHQVIEKRINGKVKKAKVCRLTLIGEKIVSGDMKFVEALRLQLQRYQYPSAASWSGSGEVDHNFHVHPFQFIFRLLRDPRLDNRLTMQEMHGIVIHKATSDSKDVYENVVSCIVESRHTLNYEFIPDTKTKTYSDIANTLFNYINITQYIDRGLQYISVRSGKENAVDQFIEESPSFILRPDLSENYLRRYGRGLVAMDRRNFDHEDVASQKQLREKRIYQEYLLIALKTPIKEITTDIIEEISNNTGIDEKIVEDFLRLNHSEGNIDDFFASYRDLASMLKSNPRDRQAIARQFEEATCEIFKKIFCMRAEHIGSKGTTPDVFVESEEEEYCGIIDNKAYHKGYSLNGDHKRVMIDEYIPKYKQYVKTEFPLAFFTYISGSFGKRINSGITDIIRSTGVSGSAMPVDLFINLAQDYAENGYNHAFLRKVFSVGREVRLADITPSLDDNTYEQEELALVAESKGEYKNSTTIDPK